MKGMHRQFSPEMKDFLARLGLSVRNAPGAWSVIWELPKTSEEDPHFYWPHPATYQAIKTEISSLQFLTVGPLIAGAINLRSEHNVEIEDRPVDLAAYIRGEKKIFYGFRLGENVLYYAVAWPRGKLMGILKARDLLDCLVKGNMKSDYLPYLPESPLVEFLAERFGMEWVRCLHEEYYYGEQRFRYISIHAQPLEHGLSIRVFLFDKQESLDWLRSQASEFPEDERRARERVQRIMYKVQGRKLLVFEKDLRVQKGVKSKYDIPSCLAEFSENFKGVEFDLSPISVASFHSVDPDWEWKHMLSSF